MKADVYSAGVILYTMLSGLSPFYGQNKQEVLAKNKEARITFPTEHWKGINECAIDLLRNMLENDPAKRFSAAQCLKHQWLCDPAMISSNTSLSLTLENLSKYYDEYKCHQA